MKVILTVLCLILLFLVQNGAFAQIQGTITDKQHASVEGVTIENLSTKNKVISNERGNFSIQAEIGHRLLFTHTRYASKELNIVNLNPIFVELQEQVIDLEEVVAVGYGTTKKKDLTGAVVSVNVSQLDNSKVGTATSALQGLATGVYVTTGSVKPGGDASVLIRGQGSINAGNTPLYIIDGLPVENGLQDLSINEIETIDVLKDASAASIYGSRGSNGVVLITTKKGQSGQGKLSFLANYGHQKMLNKQPLMDASQYYELANMANPGYSWTSDELRWISKGESTDWQDAVTQNGEYKNYNLSFSGGSDKTTSFIGLDWYDQ